MVKKKSNTFRNLSIVFLVLSLLSFAIWGFGIGQTVFPDLTPEDRVQFLNQKGETFFTEMDTLTAINIDATVGRTFRGYAIWIDDNLCKISQVPAQDRNQQSSSNPDGRITTFDKNFFEFYGLKGNPDEVTECKLTAGEHLVESLSLTAGEGLNFIGDFGYTRKKINVVSLPCVLEENQFLAKKIYIQGEKASKSTLPLSSDFVKFCSAFPVLKVDQFTLTASPSLELLSRLSNNQEIVIPEGQLYEITWVIQGENKCSSTEAYNPDLKLCQSQQGLAGIVQFLTIRSQDEKVELIQEINTQGDSNLGVVKEDEIKPVSEVEITIDNSEVLT